MSHERGEKLPTGITRLQEGGFRLDPWVRDGGPMQSVISEECGALTRADTKTLAEMIARHTATIIGINRIREEIRNRKEIL